MGARSVTALALLCLFWELGWAQEQEKGKEPRENQDRRQSRQRRQRQFQRPVFLSGKVILDDGSVPPAQVPVDLVCQGRVIRQEHTSSGGTFSFQINLGRGPQGDFRPLDASISSSSGSPFGGGLGPDGASGSLGSRIGIIDSGSVNLSACELQAELAGFQSERIVLGPRRVLDNPDVGVIVLHRRESAEGGTISLKTLAAPKKAVKAFEKAGKELRKKKINYSKVTKELEEAVEIYPEFAAAWQLLGEARIELMDLAAARQAFGRALAADSQFVYPYLSLATLEMDEKEWENAARLSSQALEINPRLPRAHYFNALANSSLGNLDVAEESVLLVQNSNQAQSYPLTHYILGWIMSQKGNFESAAVEYRRFLELQPTATIGKELQEQVAEWQALGLIENSESPDLQKP